MTSKNQTTLLGKQGLKTHGRSTALSITGTPVTTATVDAPYAGFTVACKGGTSPYAYSLVAGTWPTGITLNASTGAVSGTPTTEETQTGLIIRGTDHNGSTANLPAFQIAVAATYTCSRGALTKAGAGGVLTNLLVGLPATQTTSWSITAGDASNHWQVVAGCIVPTTAGASAHLNLGPYVLTLTDSVSSASVVLTIAIRANTYTVSKPAEIVAIIGTGGDSNAAICNGKTVEFAKYSTLLGLATNASPITFLKWRCSSTNRCTVKHEDHTAPCDLGAFEIRLCRNLDLVSLRVNTLVRVSSATSEKAWYLRSTNPTADAPNVDGVRFLDTYGSCGVDGSPTLSLSVTGIQIDNAAAAGGGTGQILNVEVYNWEAYNVSNSIHYNCKDNPTSTVTMEWFGRTLTRYWGEDALRVDSDALQVHFEYICDMSPMQDFSLNGIHQDTLQVDNNCSISGVVIDKLDTIIADGTHGQTHCIFGHVEGLDPVQMGLTVGSILMVGRSIHGITASGVDSTHVLTAGQGTFITQWSGVYGTSSLSPVFDNTPGGVLNPGMEFAASDSPANTHVKNMFLQGRLANTAGVATPGFTVLTSGNGGDISGYFPNASWISSVALKANADAHATVQNYTGLDDFRWHGSTEEVLTAVYAAVTPVLGGALKNMDGTYQGAFFPNGTRNDGSVYVP